MDGEKIRRNAFNETRQKKKKIKRKETTRLEKKSRMQADSRKTYVISL